MKYLLVSELTEPGLYHVAQFINNKWEDESNLFTDISKIELRDRDFYKNYDNCIFYGPIKFELSWPEDMKQKVIDNMLIKDIIE